VLVEAARLYLLLEGLEAGVVLQLRPRVGRDLLAAVAVALFERADDFRRAGSGVAVAVVPKAKAAISWSVVASAASTCGVSPAVLAPNPRLHASASVAVMTSSTSSGHSLLKTLVYCLNRKKSRFGTSIPSESACEADSDGIGLKKCDFQPQESFVIRY
jgi:hypothetical protein